MTSIDANDLYPLSVTTDIYRTVFTLERLRRIYFGRQLVQLCLPIFF